MRQAVAPEFLVPKRVTIETIFGCNARCVMCPIDAPTERRKGVMPLDLFRGIIDSLVPYRDQLQMMDLFCLGEPLLDPHIFARIRYVKDKGFRNLGFSTNVDLLTEARQRQLLESGIDTVIFSIDGASKATHEGIRRRTDFDRVVAHATGAIRMRNEGGYATRFVVRFIRQEANAAEWPAYREFWAGVISPERGDFIAAYDAHNWGGQVGDGCGAVAGSMRPCQDIFDVLYILCDGTVPLCRQDWLHPNFNFGNVRDRPPLEIFNAARFHRVRGVHAAGRREQLPMCRTCGCDASADRKERWPA
jgi:sulfatase maturation enzyme AslB (radical SAM superfamily)